MFLIFTAIAAIISTILWYVNLPQDKYSLGFLSLVYWGATLMWIVDHVIAYLQDGGPVLDVSAGASVLGLLVIIAGILIWLVYLLIKGTKKSFGKNFIKGR